jgi:hypothetical protein
VRTNRNGKSHYFNCGSNGHWANKCPEAEEEQLVQLQMNLGAKGEEEAKGKEDKEGATHMHVTMLQGEGLSKTCGYLDNCSTITAFVNREVLDNITTVTKGMKVNCNVGAVQTNQRGEYGSVKPWYLPEGIANIFPCTSWRKCIASPTTAGTVST